MSIATQISALQADKTAIATAITNKGGTVNSGDGFDDFATDIATIPACDTVTATNASSSVVVSGGKVWLEKSGQSYTIKDFYVAPNVGYQKTGNVTITDNVASGFSTSKYLTVNLSALGSVWDIYCKITTPSSLTATGQKIFMIGTYNSEYNPALCFINNSGQGLYFKTGTGARNILDTGTSDAYTLSANTTYYLRLGCDGTNTYAYISTSGFGNMTLIKQVADVSSISADVLNLGYEPVYTSKSYFKGSIDLTQTYIKKNGKVLWSAANPNIDVNNLYSGVAEEAIAVNGSGNVKTVGV